jgi:hypothetical protein
MSPDMSLSQQIAPLGKVTVTQNHPLVGPP